MRSIEESGRIAVLRLTGEERPLFIYLMLAHKRNDHHHLTKIHTQARLVVLKWIREVEVSISFSIIELNSDSVMRFLINSPHEASKI